MENRIRSEILWSDRKRVLGLPLCPECYQISADRLHTTVGFWRLDQNEIELHKIRNLSVKCSFSQRCCGVGTVIVTTKNRIIKLTNIREPFAVKELLHECVERQKERRRFLYPAPPIWYS